MKTLTEENFTAAMRAVVEERGADFVYPPEWRNMAGHCEYMHGGNPACIIGAALEKIDPLYLYTPQAQANMAATLVLDVLGGDLRLQVAARIAQVAQDSGGTWGKALELYSGALALHEDHGIEAQL